MPKFEDDDERGKWLEDLMIREADEARRRMVLVLYMALGLVFLVVGMVFVLLAVFR